MVETGNAWDIPMGVDLVAREQDDLHQSSSYLAMPSSCLDGAVDAEMQVICNFRCLSACSIPTPLFAMILYLIADVQLNQLTRMFISQWFHRE